MFNSISAEGYRSIETSASSIWNGFPSSDNQSHSEGIYLKKYFANICNISTIELENCEEISKKSGLIVLEKFNNFWRELGKLEIRR